MNLKLQPANTLCITIYDKTKSTARLFLVFCLNLSFALRISRLTGICCYCFRREYLSWKSVNILFYQKWVVVSRTSWLINYCVISLAGNAKLFMFITNHYTLKAWEIRGLFTSNFTMKLHEVFSFPYSISSGTSKYLLNRSLLGPESLSTWSAAGKKFRVFTRNRALTSRLTSALRRHYTVYAVNLIIRKTFCARSKLEGRVGRCFYQVGPTHKLRFTVLLLRALS